MQLHGRLHGRLVDLGGRLLERRWLLERRLRSVGLPDLHGRCDADVHAHVQVLSVWRLPLIFDRATSKVARSKTVREGGRRAESSVRDLEQLLALVVALK